MDSNLKSCSTCLSDFDLNTRLPRIIPACGHTICSACLKYIARTQGRFKCTIDKKVCQVRNDRLESYPENKMLKKILEENAKFEKCKIHQKTIDMYCFIDKCRVCAHCGIIGAHKGHVLGPLEEVQTKVDKVRAELKSMLGQLDEFYKGMDRILEAKRVKSINEVENQFKDLTVILENKKQELFSEIHLVFNTEKTKMLKSLGVISPFRTSLNEKISSLRNVYKTEGLSDFLQDDIEVLLKQFKTQVSTEHTKEFESMLNRALEPLNEAILINKQSILNLRVPNETFSREVGNFYMHVGNGLKFINKNEHWSVNNMLEVFNIREYEDQISLTPKDSGLNKNRVSITERQLQKITKLSLNFNESEFSPNLVPSVSYILRNAENLRSIRIDFSNTQVSSQEILSICLPMTGYAKRINEFELLLESCNIDDNSIEGLLVDVVSQMVELKTLVFNLSKTKTTNKTINTLTNHVLLQTKKLNSLAIDLRYTEINDVGLSYLKVSNENLLRFVLHLDFTAITDVGIKKFTENNLEDFHCLESFELRLQGTNITDDGINQLISYINPRKHFSLHLQSTNITDLSLETLGKSSLSKNQELSSFSMNLGLTRITDEGISQILFNVDSIRDFSLNLSSTQVTDKSILPFIKSTFPLMKALENFEINLEGTGITDESIIGIFNNMEELKSIKLYLGSTNISDASIDAFAQNTLCTVNNLDHFELDLYSTKMTDQSISQLFHYMRPVRFFKLNLSYTSIGDQSIESFTQLTLPILKDLEYFEMNLEGTQVSDKSICSLLDSIPDVKELVLNVKYTQVNNENIEVLIEKLIENANDSRRIRIVLGENEANDIFSRVGLSK